MLQLVGAGVMTRWSSVARRVVAEGLPAEYAIFGWRPLGNWLTGKCPLADRKPASLFAAVEFSVVDCCAEFKLEPQGPHFPRLEF